MIKNISSDPLVTGGTGTPGADGADGAPGKDGSQAIGTMMIVATATSGQSSSGLTQAQILARGLGA